jgi:ABC-type hemin transport system substrate-binding protein
VVAEQQARIDELSQCLRRDEQAGDFIAQYEQDLGTVADQIDTLNGLIRSKNEEF